MEGRRIRIGTRGSRLARLQAGMVRDLLAAAHPGAPPPELVVIATSGDRLQHGPLADAGGKGLFTREIEAALRDRRVDLAVHSMKDLPAALPPGLVVDCLLPRGDPRDALVGAGGSLAALPPGAVLGTSSPRRAALALYRRPDLRIVPLRGNVETRLRRVAEGRVAATLLAVAGLRRLGLEGRAAAVLEPEDMLPAAAQGAIGVERRAADGRMAAALAPLNDPATATCVAAERALLAALGGSCRTPVAALARLGDGILRLRALLAEPDGSRVIAAAREGPAADARALGADAGAELRRRAGSGPAGARP